MFKISRTFKEPHALVVSLTFLLLVFTAFGASVLSSSVVDSTYDQLHASVWSSWQSALEAVSHDDGAQTEAMPGEGTGGAVALASHEANIVVHNPLIINEGGLYENCRHNSTDYTIAAVTINTNEQVTIENCVLSGAGIIINADGVDANIIIKNNYIYGRNPNINGQQQGRWLYTSSINNAIITDNFIYQTGGMRLRGNTAGYTGKVNVERNVHKDLTKAFSNGSGLPCRDGYDTVTQPAGSAQRQFATLNQITVDQNTVAPIIRYNLVFNNPWEHCNVSATEDLINIFSSGGASPQNLLTVSDNALIGAHGIDPSNNSQPFYGTCIVTDSATANDDSFGYIDISRNYLAMCQNSGINIVDGGFDNGQYNIKVYDNVIKNPKTRPGGSSIGGYGWYDLAAGVFEWNNRNVYGVEFYNNRAHSYKATSGNASRNDYWLPACGQNAGDTNYCHDNQSLPDGVSYKQALDTVCDFKQAMMVRSINVGPDWGVWQSQVGYDNCTLPNTLLDDVYSN